MSARQFSRASRIENFDLRTTEYEKPGTFADHGSNPALLARVQTQGRASRIATVRGNVPDYEQSVFC
jgi:hypothetical protein